MYFAHVKEKEEHRLLLLFVLLENQIIFFLKYNKSYTILEKNILSISDMFLFATEQML